MKTLFVSQPFFGQAEIDLAGQALARGEWSGHAGSFNGQFETAFSGYCDCAHGVTASNGTAAIHLALAALGIKPGDEVLVSTLTNMATFFAVMYQGATPVPVDIEPDTFNIDPGLIESRITPRTRGILVVHLFGHPVDMQPVMDIARRHGLFVVEDCAEAHGATYRGKKVGSLGVAGCFSFYANKIITTGEGGMVTTNDDALAGKMRVLKGLAFGDELKFMHKDVGFNYRLTNIQAAIGCAQVARIEEVVARKRRIASLYSQALGHVERLQLPVEKEYARNVYWMYHLNVRGMDVTGRRQLMDRLKEQGIETREGFIPYNLQREFIARGLTRPEECPVAAGVAYSTLYLPSGPELTEGDVGRVAEGLTRALSA